MLYRLVFLLAAGVLVAACDSYTNTLESKPAEKKAPRAAVQTAPAPVAKAAAPRNPMVLIDQSWAPEKYAALGMPGLEAPWTARDYTAALACLKKVIAEHAQPPRAVSAFSGPTYSRMVNFENLRAISSSDYAINDRVNAGATLLPAMRDVARLYAQQSQAMRDYDQERSDLYVTILHGVASFQPLLDEYATTLDDESPAYKQALAALDRWRKLCLELTEECLGALEEADHFRPEVRVRMAQRFAEELPAIFEHIPPVTGSAWIQHFSDVAAKEKDAEMITALTDLAKACRGQPDAPDVAPPQ